MIIGSFSVETCYEACYQYKYFALQANATLCMCDNDYTDATRYGTTTGCTNGTGGSWQNALYEITESMLY